MPTKTTRVYIIQQEIGYIDIEHDIDLTDEDIVSLAENKFYSSGEFEHIDQSISLSLDQNTLEKEPIDNKLSQRGKLLLEKLKNSAIFAKDSDTIEDVIDVTLSNGEIASYAVISNIKKKLELSHILNINPRIIPIDFYLAYTPIPKNVLERYFNQYSNSTITDVQGLNNKLKTALAYHECRDEFIRKVMEQPVINGINLFAKLLAAYDHIELDLGRNLYAYRID